MSKQHKNDIKDIEKFLSLISSNHKPSKSNANSISNINTININLLNEAFANKNNNNNRLTTFDKIIKIVIIIFTIVFICGSNLNENHPWKKYSFEVNHTVTAVLILASVSNEKIKHLAAFIKHLPAYFRN